MNPEDGDRFAHAFLKAAQSGDTANLRKLLAAEAVRQSDGGGVKLAAVHAIERTDKIVHFLERVFHKFDEQRLVRIGRINGTPSVITIDREGIMQTATLEICDGSIAAIYIVTNPNKLVHIEGLSLRHPINIVLGLK